MCFALTALEVHIIVPFQTGILEIIHKYTIKRSKCDHTCFLLIEKDPPENLMNIIMNMPPKEILLSVETQWFAQCLHSGVGCPPELRSLVWRIVSLHILQGSLLFCLWLWLLFYRLSRMLHPGCAAVLPCNRHRGTLVPRWSLINEGAPLILHNTEKTRGC